ncbi:hypothetical protein SNEBB_002108 [Seison nebaliae]|nr:hypothetical protein SNEBB_002108 [Seison nebaliae]
MEDNEANEVEDSVNMDDVADEKKEESPNESLKEDNEMQIDDQPNTSDENAPKSVDDVDQLPEDKADGEEITDIEQQPIDDEAGDNSPNMQQIELDDTSNDFYNDQRLFPIVIQTEKDSQASETNDFSPELSIQDKDSLFPKSINTEKKVFESESQAFNISFAPKIKKKLILVTILGERYSYKTTLSKMLANECNGVYLSPFHLKYWDYWAENRRLKHAQPIRNYYASSKTYNSNMVQLNWNQSALKKPPMTKEDEYAARKLKLQENYHKLLNKDYKSGIFELLQKIFKSEYEQKGKTLFVLDDFFLSQIDIEYFSDKVGNIDIVFEIGSSGRGKINKDRMASGQMFELNKQNNQFFGMKSHLHYRSFPVNYLPPISDRIAEEEETRGRYNAEGELIEKTTDFYPYHYVENYLSFNNKTQLTEKDKNFLKSRRLKRTICSRFYNEEIQREIRSPDDIEPSDLVSYLKHYKHCVTKKIKNNNDLKCMLNCMIYHLNTYVPTLEGFNEIDQLFPVYLKDVDRDVDEPEALKTLYKHYTNFDLVDNGATFTNIRKTYKTLSRQIQQNCQSSNPFTAKNLMDMQNQSSMKTKNLTIPKILRKPVPSVSFGTVNVVEVD